jgi:hypothetical protein
VATYSAKLGRRLASIASLIDAVVSAHCRQCRTLNVDVRSSTYYIVGYFNSMVKIYPKNLLVFGPPGSISLLQAGEPHSMDDNRNAEEDDHPQTEKCGQRHA